MVFPLWSPLVVFILVVLLFFSDLLTIFVTSRLMTVVLSSWPNSKFVNLSFVLLVCMLLIEIWRELNFFCYVSSAIDPSIPTVVRSNFNAEMDWSLDRLGSATLTFLERVVTFSPRSFTSVPFSTPGDIYIPTLGFSWSRPDGLISSRIDLSGCPFSWPHALKSCELVPRPFSDHSALVMSSPVPTPTPRGLGRWKLKRTSVQKSNKNEILW